ncbi:RHS repeat protein [Collimonas humicola]|uniref:RHS repeat protein n=1 Tax=Collimonas humicola TaxID=2825886 RepID=UPI001B8D5798|nr:RHS repeat protein [Collimonas humicola]
MRRADGNEIEITNDQWNLKKLIQSHQIKLTLLGLMSLISMSVVHARDTNPHMFYINAWWTDADKQGKYDTPEEAFEINKANFMARYPGTTVLDLYAPPNQSAWYNGVPLTFNMHYVTAGDPTIYEANAVLTSYECSKDTGVNGDGAPHYTITCTPNPNTQKPETQGCLALGKPIYPSTGIEKLTETDYAGSGANALRFSRTYRSDRNTWVNNYQVAGVDFTAPQQVLNANSIYSGCYPGTGNQTGRPYCFAYAPTGLANDFAVQRGNGRMLAFGTTSNLSPAADINDRVTKTDDGTSWKVYNADNDSTEIYDLTGRLQTSTARDGQVQTWTYSDVSTPVNIAPKSGLLIRVTDHFGAQLNFTYDAAARMVKMTDPAGGIYSYAYDEASSTMLAGSSPANNLTSVTYPDGKKRTYWYNEQDKTANTNLQVALTGITDENSARYAIITYNSAGKAVSTELAGGVQKFAVSYPNLFTQSSVTDPLGTTRTYNFQTVLGVVKSTGQSQPSGAGCSAASNSTAYDANGNVATSTDFNGNVTTYNYDLARNLEISRVEGSGTSQARTITTAWHAMYRLPLQIAEPKLLTTYAYDTSGNLLSKTVQATSDATGAQGLSPTLVGTARTWSYTYNTVGQVLTAIGPRTDVADKTIYTYDSSGNLSTITNAVGQVTTLSNYDANGRVGLITDANGATTALTYSPRGWLTGKTVTSGGTVETTAYGYDGVGQLTLVTLPNTSTVSYTYDPAHRLTNIADNLGNSIAYTLDNMGNRISEQVKDPSGALARQTSRVVDALNRLQQITGEMH